MYICAFSFDINWFTTLPGMLIAGGVVLLLLALILFAASGKRKKVQKEDVVDTNVAPSFSNPNMNANVGIDPTVNSSFTSDSNIGVVNNESVTPVFDQSASFQTAPVDSNSIGTQTVNPVEVSPINNEVSPVNVEPVNPVNAEPISPVDVNPINNNTENNGVNSMNKDSVLESVNSVDPAPLNDTSVAKEASAISPVMEENTPQTSDISTETPTENSTQVQSEVHEAVIPSVDSTTTAYGGVSPSVTLPKEESSHQIYGGANPLDKTQTIPIINNPVEQNRTEERQEEKTTEIPAVSSKEQPAYQEAKLVEDKDIEVLDF